MNNHKRRFRPRQHKNNFRRRSNGSVNNNGHFQSNVGNKNFVRNGSMNNPFNIEKAIQKYRELAKDALSSGDPVLSENYLQHADHFSRKLADLNFKSKDQVLSKDQALSKDAKNNLNNTIEQKEK